jgi:hypothetical protein
MTTIFYFVEVINLKQGYKRMNQNELIKYMHYQDDLQKAAKFFKEQFIGKIVVFESEHYEVEINFIASNFMHMCGMDYEYGASAFFQRAMKKKLDKNKLYIKKDESTWQKLQVLGSVDYILTKNTSISGRGNFLKLQYELAVRTKKRILAIPLVRNHDTYRPLSLLNLHTKDIPAGEPVKRIYSINLQSQEKFNYFEE